MKVNVKWGKETFSDIEVDLDQSPLMFKTQLFTLSGVPPERQKIMVKGGLLKDDDWGKQQPKEGQTLMMMGSADPIAVEPPKNVPTFMEDLPEAKQLALTSNHFGSGLANLGNTCYMNATVQCLFSVEALRAAVARHAGPGTDPAGRLVDATKELFADMAKGGEPFPPYQFLMMLRQRYPQFAQTGREGAPMQQDAEECFTQLMYTLHEKVKVGAGASAAAL
jgi:ubiquitin carboxyl-terminal hydrolase 14